MDLFEYITRIYNSIVYIIEELQMEATDTIHQYGGVE